MSLASKRKNSSHSTLSRVNLEEYTYLTRRHNLCPTSFDIGSGMRFWSNRILEFCLKESIVLKEPELTTKIVKIEAILVANILFLMKGQSRRSQGVFAPILSDSFYWSYPNYTKDLISLFGPVLAWAVSLCGSKPCSNLLLQFYFHCGWMLQKWKWWIREVCKQHTNN